MKHFTVAGRVQGVGFRAWAEDKAKSLNLSGWVRNLSDGRVEIMAQGEEKDELAFWQACQKGPLFSKVIEICWVSVPIAAEPPLEKGIFKIVASA
ncbi:MAG: acylphosphatase [Alphaproteobacteria bacterium]